VKLTELPLTPADRMFLQRPQPYTPGSLLQRPAVAEPADAPPAEPADAPPAEPADAPPAEIADAPPAAPVAPDDDNA
jgi:hypothetical protein